jgi:ketosteroid isomerase-like protein
MHPNEERLRTAYEAFARGDLDAYLAMCADDIEFHVPGSTPFSGVHTKADFPQWITGVMEIAQGSFREVPYGFVANDDHGVVMLDHYLQRDGRDIHYRTNHLYDFLDGSFARWEEWPASEEAFNQAWS